MRTFRSDNNAGVCPEALDAILRAGGADGGHAMGYGGDDETDRAVAQFRDLFSDRAHVFFVATGTAANTLGIASLTRPWQRVLAHSHSHWNDDESTAPELFTGCRTTLVTTAMPGAGSRLTVDDLRRAAAATRGDVHQPQPGVLTVSNTTEFGEVYTPEHTAALAREAHAMGFRLHVDGARFANAVAALLARRGIDPTAADLQSRRADVAALCRALTVDAGVDALSFGGTKNGLALGEAVIFFEQPSAPGGETTAKQAAHDFPYLRKRAGHLLSKHRFVAAPFAVTLARGAWLRHAGHANAMAATLAVGLRRLDITPAFPVEANALFVRLPSAVDQALRAAGHGYYPFGEPSWGLSRLMCSFDTTEADVAGLLADAAAGLHR